MEDGRSKTAIEGQDWLLENLPHANLMVPGRGSAQTRDFSMVAATRAYMQQLRDRMGEAVEAGIEFQDAVNGSDFPEWEGVRL